MKSVILLVLCCLKQYETQKLPDVDVIDITDVTHMVVTFIPKLVQKAPDPDVYVKETLYYMYVKEIVFLHEEDKEYNNGVSKF